MRNISISFMLLLGMQTAMAASEPLKIDLATTPRAQAVQAFPALKPIDPPLGLRPCCAFGYNIKAKAMGISVPLYELENVVEAKKLGNHDYNDVGGLGFSNLFGMSDEKSGIIYTRKGGFIDIAHVRDTADNTLFVFSQLLPKLGTEFYVDMSDELAKRRVHFNAFSAPKMEKDRYTLAAYIAAKLGFQMAPWHEIAQSYGFRSVSGFSEEISAFSPEDLYSNLLGARLALDIILQGHAKDVKQFQAAIDGALPVMLEALGAVSNKETKLAFNEVNGTWWDSNARAPEKFLVLKRNYNMTDKRSPEMIPSEKEAPLHITLPDSLRINGINYRFDQLGELRFMTPDDAGDLENLPKPATYYTWRDFDALAQKAKIRDDKELHQHLK